MRRLTATYINSLKPKNKPYRIADTQTGLYIEIRPSGAKIFRYLYKSPVTGSRTMKSIGEYPITSLQEARKEAMRLQEMVAKGKDPNRKKAKKKSKKVLRLEDIAKEYLQRKERELTHRYYAIYLGRYENYIAPTLGKKALSKITKRDIVELVRKVPSQKLRNDTKNGSKAIVAKRVFGILRELLQYASDLYLIPHNPANDINVKNILPPHTPQPMKAATTIEELRRVIRSIQRMDSLIVKNALLFQAVGALRQANVIKLRWEYIDLNRKIITYPKEAMKAKKPFRFPITKRIENIIETMGEVSGDSTYLFPSPSKNGKHLSENALNTALRRLGWDLHSHGFRSSFSTLAREHSDFPTEVIEAQLAHTLPSAVIAAYARTDYLEKRRELLSWWENFIFEE